jgi:hypothetical protein
MNSRRRSPGVIASSGTIRDPAWDRSSPRTATRRSPWRDSMTIGPSRRRSGPRGGPSGQPPPALGHGVPDHGRADGLSAGSTAPACSMPMTLKAPAPRPAAVDRLRPARASRSTRFGLTMDGRAAVPRSSASPYASSTVGAPACHGPCRPRRRSAGFAADRVSNAGHVTGHIPSRGWATTRITVICWDQHGRGGPNGPGERAGRGWRAARRIDRPDRSNSTTNDQKQPCRAHECVLISAHPSENESRRDDEGSRTAVVSQPRPRRARRPI